jgi:hypothetical protein
MTAGDRAFNSIVPPSNERILRHYALKSVFGRIALGEVTGHVFYDVEDHTPIRVVPGPAEGPLDEATQTEILEFYSGCNITLEYGGPVPIDEVNQLLAELAGDENGR